MLKCQKINYIRYFLKYYIYYKQKYYYKLTSKITYITFFPIIPINYKNILLYILVRLIFKVFLSRVDSLFSSSSWLHLNKLAISLLVAPVKENKHIKNGQSMHWKISIILKKLSGNEFFSRILVMATKRTQNSCKTATVIIFLKY